MWYFGWCSWHFQILHKVTRLSFWVNCSVTSIFDVICCLGLRIWYFQILAIVTGFLAEGAACFEPGGSIPLNRPIQLAICSPRLEPPKLSPGIKYFVWDQIWRVELEKRRLVYQDVAPLTACLPLPLRTTPPSTLPQLVPLFWQLSRLNKIQCCNFNKIFFNFFQLQHLPKALQVYF